eukprot:3457491-Rhodomonas_salina.1
MDSHLFVVGGINWGGAGGHLYLPEFWEFSLTTQSWTDLSSLLFPGLQLENAGSTVSGGKLYITAWGLYEWDPVQRSWRDLSNHMLMPERTGYRAALGAIDGVLYRYGGSFNWPPVPTNNLYTLRISDLSWTDRSGV